jgi:hypothetical protein
VVNSTYELIAALANTSIDSIWVEPGIYTFEKAVQCTSASTLSALCVSRNVTIDAALGTVVLDALGSASQQRRVLSIAAGMVNLAGLNLTGGYIMDVITASI